MNELVEFKTVNEQSMKQVTNPFDGVRTSVVDGKMYWCLTDFCKLLGYLDPKKAVRDKVVYTETWVSVLSTHDNLGRDQNTKFGTIDVLNEIVMKSKLNNDMVNQWKQFSYKVSQEAMKSQLGIENDIDKMVNERVEKAIALQNNNNSMIQLLIEQGKRSDMLLVQMQEDSKRREEDSKRRDEENKRFYAELFGKTNKLEAKVETVNLYKLSISEIATYIPGYNASSLNNFLVAHEYLYKNNGILYPTNKMKALNYCKDSGNKYHTLYYRDEMIDFMKNLVEQYKIDNEMF